jgi:hypothetical protein
MHHVPELETLIRPRNLVMAARHAVPEYRRDALLPSLLGVPVGQRLPPRSNVIRALLQREAKLEHARRHRCASWGAGAHVLVLAALLAEAATAPSCLSEAVTLAGG